MSHAALFGIRQPGSSSTWGAREVLLPVIFDDFDAKALMERIIAGEMTVRVEFHKGMPAGEIELLVVAHFQP